MIGKCGICGEELRSHKSDKHSAKRNFLSVLRKHMWKKHRATMIKRIREGKQKNNHNPIIQDFSKALSQGAVQALNYYKTMTKAQYNHTKKVMGYIEILLTPEQRAVWEIVKNIGDSHYGY